MAPTGVQSFSQPAPSLPSPASVPSLPSVLSLESASEAPSAPATSSGLTAASESVPAVSSLVLEQP